MRSMDVAVIGAGPAGLSAAVRLRWVKVSRGMPSSAIVYDPAPVGGLGLLGRTRLAGPSSHSIMSSLIDDAEALQIPFEPYAIDRVEPHGIHWRLMSRGEVMVEARAVVLATGMRRLANEAEFFGRGVTVTYNSYNYLPEHIEMLLAAPHVRNVLVVGNAKTANILPIFQGVERPELSLKFLLDEAPSDELAARFGGSDTLFGHVMGYSGGDHLERVMCRDTEGHETYLPCNLAFVDYAAFELKPERTLYVPGLARDPRGFVVVERDGSTSLSGIFAAGDATGVYSMALKAFSEGAVAGLTASRYVFMQKFGYDPPLFAYTMQDHAIDPDKSDYPELISSDIIELLGGIDEANKVAAETVNMIPFGDTVQAYPRRYLFAELEQKVGVQGARDLIHALLDEKLCTIQPQESTPRRPAPRMALL